MASAPPRGCLERGGGPAARVRVGRGGIEAAVGDAPSGVFSRARAAASSFSFLPVSGSLNAENDST